MQLAANTIGLASFRSTLIVLAFGLLAACSTTQETAPRRQSAMPLTSKYAAIVVDAGTGKTLYEANSTASRFPASLTKMMTLYLLFEALDSGGMSMATEIPVSDYARTRPPSKLGIKRGESISAETAIEALATKSANDVAVAVAEFLGGSEDRFAAIMTGKARSLGMSGTTFQNASGLPDDGQRTTARDMAILGMALKNRYPGYYGYFSKTSFAFHGRTVNGHNELIGSVEGVDGIKTGYIKASGYNIVTSVRRGGKRLVIVVMGGDSAKGRNAHVRELIARYMPDKRDGGVIGAMLWD